jgi:hypothetical protein
MFIAWCYSKMENFIAIAIPYNINCEIFSPISLKKDRTRRKSLCARQAPEQSGEFVLFKVCWSVEQKIPCATRTQ